MSIKFLKFAEIWYLEDHHCYGIGTLYKHAQWCYNFV